MVRKIAVACVILLAGLGILSGCTKGSSPVSPRTGNVNLSLPVAAIKAQIKAQNIVSSASATFEVRYNIVPQAGGSAVQGSLNVDLTSNDNPTLSAALPGIGKYLVAVEVFNLGGNSPVNPSLSKVKQIAGTNAVPMDSVTTARYPVLLGAGEVNVQSSMGITLKLGRLDTPCYKNQVRWTSSGEVGGVGYNFDQAMSPSLGQKISDIEMDANGALVNGVDATKPFISYLGNGDLVDYPQLPADGKWRTNSVDAKGGPLAIGDVFVLKAPTKAGALVWMQVNSVELSSTNNYASFCFRYNDDGYNYYRFDMTSYGQINCNDAIQSNVSSIFQNRRTMFGRVGGVDADANGNLYVVDTGSGLLDVIDAAGNTTYVGTSQQLSNPLNVAVGKGSPASIYVLDGDQVKVFNGASVLLNSFYPNIGGPTGIATDKWGAVYISFQNATQFNGVMKYDYLGGSPVSFVGDPSAGSDPGKFSTAAGMAVADNGDLYVADTGNARVQVFDKNGAYLRQITALNGPYDVALDGSGGLWVMDGNRVIKFNASTGNAISGFSSWYDAQSNYYYFYGSNQSIAFGNGYLFVGSFDGDYGNAVDTFKP